MKTRAKGMFWAVFFIAVGIILLVQHVFKIDLPIIKILFGLFLIYMGVKVLASSFNVKVRGFTVDKISTDSKAVFSNSNFKVKGNAGYTNESFTSVFGSSVLDMTGLTEEDLKKDYKIENAFGKTTVTTDADTPIIAWVESGFASVEIRDQKISSFGEAEIKTSNYDATKPALKLKIEAAFGSVEVK